MMIANNPVENPKDAKYVPVKFLPRTLRLQTRSVRFQKLMFFCYPLSMPPLSIHLLNQMHDSLVRFQLQDLTYLPMLLKYSLLHAVQKS